VAIPAYGTSGAARAAGAERELVFSTTYRN